MPSPSIVLSILNIVNHCLRVCYRLSLDEVGIILHVKRWGISRLYVGVCLWIPLHCYYWIGISR